MGIMVSINLKRLFCGSEDVSKGGSPNGKKYFAITLNVRIKSFYAE
jgi:hypothetical protein